MKRALTTVLAAAVFGLTLTPGLYAATPSTAELQTEIRQLRQDLDDLKKQLQARNVLPPPSVQPIDAVVEVGGGPAKGDANAPVTVVEFSDYQCPFCARHARSTVPQLQQEYIASGKVRYVFRDMPILQGKGSAKIAEAAHCAGDQGRYWPMHDRLFAQQREVTAENLPSQAEALGLDAAAFKTCLDDGRHRARVAADVATGRRLGVSGTPAFFVGRSDGDKLSDVRMMRGALPYAAFKEQIDALLDKAAAAPAPR